MLSSALIGQCVGETDLDGGWCSFVPVLGKVDCCTWSEFKMVVWWFAVFKPWPHSSSFLPFTLPCPLLLSVGAALRAFRPGVALASCSSFTTRGPSPAHKASASSRSCATDKNIYLNGQTEIVTSNHFFCHFCFYDPQTQKSCLFKQYSLQEQYYNLHKYQAVHFNSLFCPIICHSSF